MSRQTLIVMVKEPVAGRVKTRLGREIGMTDAAWWFRHQTRALLRRVQDPRWQVVLSVSPDSAVGSRIWAGHSARIPQGRGDLGARMLRAMRSVSGPVVLIGGDIPGVRSHHIADAFRVLGACPSVVGPAKDGGFWLIGLRHPSRLGEDALAGVRWSQPTTLTEALPCLPQPVRHVAMLYDVDTKADLQRWIATRERP